MAWWAVGKYRWMTRRKPNRSISQEGSQKVTVRFQVWMTAVKTIQLTKKGSSGISGFGAQDSMIKRRLIITR